MKKILSTSIVMTVVSFAAAAPMLAFGFDNVISVSTHNTAGVSNIVTATAKTGGNTAQGGMAGGAGMGGSVNSSDDHNTGGMGGNGGNGGDGGMVLTGDATAVAMVENHVNRTHTTVNGCGCDEDTMVKIHNTSEAWVENMVDATAKTGWNTADGGNAGGAGGNGGEVNNSDDHNMGGAGGNEGSAGWGGSVTTGAANSVSSVVNRVNVTKTRVH